MRIQSQKDFFSGLMFVAVGATFAIGATNYSIGEGARMGPGYFPLMLGILLTGLGAGILLQSLVVRAPGGEPLGRFFWKPLGFVLAANCAFGVLLGGIPALHIPAMGMILAIYALTFISSLAGGEFRAPEVALLATVLAAGSYGAFIWLLRLQIPVWPTFIA